MKKIPLAIAMTTLLAASTSFATDLSNDASPIQIYSKAFKISVKKESSIEVAPLKKEVINLEEDTLEDISESGDTLDVGVVKVEATSKNCYATVRTINNFKLKGKKTGKILADYSLKYASVDSESNGSPTSLNVQFFSNNNGEKKVACNTSDLVMTVSDYNSDAPADAYHDIITIEVRAAS